ncbi:hypothetical protein DYY88_08160 [Leptolyngbya iicbica LK]|uniref:Biotin carboxylase n=3 Tax=Cyanophyceae TaxID=3028117 RepID=A0A4Q7E8C4_9CYAN|nr:hypothetical protein [Leptolyngbya sp. LK]RZM78761.1 hypothetical protein DYY88_08160 [Leptolyngbya sp. LK]
MLRTGLKTALWTGLITCLFALTFVLTPSAHAMTPIELKDLSYAACPEEMSEGIVAPGSLQKANCYLISGTAVNRSGKPVLNADIFGRIYDANNNPAMMNRTRLGAIDEVPPGESPFELRISVAANQPEPLKLEQFKASGFTGKVRR